jgi:hypothetical protein
MIEFIKEKAAKFLINKKVKHNTTEEISFSTAFKRSFSFLVVLPDDEKDFHASLHVLRFLDEHKKSFQVVTRDYRVSLLPQIYRTRVIEVGIGELTKFDLPNHKLTDKLESMRYDSIIDLNRTENLFAIYILQVIPSKVRIGFKRKGSDKYYNLQIANNEEKAENSYNNFLNCLKMF